MKRGGEPPLVHQPGRFIWQLVGVLEMKEGNSRTGAKVMPVFSGL
jgi:hypothetical protein